MKQRKSSLAGSISLALFAIVSLSLITLLISYWLSEQVNRDPEALNVAGSLRYQTYHVAILAARNDEVRLAESVQAINTSWNHSAFRRFAHADADIYRHFREAQANWVAIEQDIRSGDFRSDLFYSQLSTQVAFIDELVMLIQLDAEKTVGALRLVLVIALFLTVILTIIVLHWLRVRFELPLAKLQQVAKQIGEGDFTARANLANKNDELGTLANTINKMSDTIGFMYGRLETRVSEQTSQLRRSHITLQLLYDISTRINEHSLNYHDFKDTTVKLRDVLGLDDLELCLLTNDGNAPYLQFQSEQSAKDPCHASNCAECVRRDEVVAVVEGVRSYYYPLSRDNKRFGVLVARCKVNESMHEWQQKLMKSVSDQLALALSLKAEEDQARRLAMVNERTVIARELHDSLAQALSYLKIQVTRLNKAIAIERQDIIADVSNELKQGLDSAYRQLRELLTTFRLKVDGDGLLNALEETVLQLQKQTSLLINLDYRIADIPLEPHEEIHLLQMIREATQNAMHHSEGKNVTIRITQVDTAEVQLAVEDDGIGIPEDPQKLNHYGLAIIRERARHLGGEVTIRRRETGGTGVYFTFIPHYLMSEVKE
ncbi:ATP-binding protein, partial [Aliidiomarina sp.]|uniref:ATP-binding protein n=1 Tax=Aliidiomarina sp. TaxID=1872439 RepID=UPI003A4DFB8D